MKQIRRRRLSDGDANLDEAKGRRHRGHRTSDVQQIGADYALQGFSAEVEPLNEPKVHLNQSFLGASILRTVGNKVLDVVQAIGRANRNFRP